MLSNRYYAYHTLKTVIQKIKNIDDPMINTEKIERIVQLAIASGYVKDETAPLSIILIAHPESAKTKIIQKFKSKHTIEASDLSAKPITDVIIPLLEKNELHHILIPDMIKVLAHKSTTVDATMTFLNALMEEGIKSQLFFGQQFYMKKRHKCGLITSCTFDYYYKIFRKWHDIGFLSRFLPISFTYSKPTIVDINFQISRNNFFTEITNIKKIAKKHITIPNDIADKISFIVNEVVSGQLKDTIRIQVRGGKKRYYKIEMYGFRLHRQIRKLLQSITLMKGKNVCQWEDMNELYKLIDYIRLPKNPKEL